MRRELDNVVLERAAFVCCDSREQARLESGDLIEPVERGVLDWLEVHELQEVVAGELRGRESRRRHRRLQVERAGRVGRRDRGRGRRARARARRRRTSSRLERRGARASAIVSLPIAWITSGRSSSRARCSGVQAVLDVAVLEDLGQRAAAVVLADHVGGDALLRLRALRRGTRRGSAKRHRATRRLYPLVECAGSSSGRALRRARARRASTTRGARSAS